MLDVDTFLTALYVMVDDFYKSRPPERRRPGPDASLSPSEVVTLAVFARFSRFSGERDFHRYARTHLRGAFPTLPDRSQFNRSVSSHVGLIEEMAAYLARMLGIQRCPYEALDSAAMPVRDAKRRGAGWLAGHADIGWSNRLGWYEGFRLLIAVSPAGVITGFGFGAASTADQPLAETFFAARRRPSSRLRSVGSVASGCYVADKGFEGVENHRRWIDRHGALLIHPPKRNSRSPWPRRLRRWVAGIRQIVETVYDKLFNTFLRPSSGASTRTERLAGSSGGEGGAAQLLHLAQRATWTPLVGFRRLAGMVTSTHTKRLKDPGLSLSRRSTPRLS